MKKRVFTLFLCLVLVASIFTIPAQARWTNCASIELGISHSNGTVSWTGSILGHSDTTKITANYKLEKYNSTSGKYEYVDEWTGLETTTRTILNSSGSATGTKGTYRLTLDCVVKSASYSESISVDSVKTFT